MDMIDRQTAIDEIKGMSIFLELCIGDDRPTMPVISVDRVLNKIESLQSAEPEIIQCKDCVHHHYEKGHIPYCDNIDYGYGWEDDDYCSKAERRNDDGYD